LDFCHHNYYFCLGLIFPENKTVGRMEKCFIVDFWDCFYYVTTEIRHLDLLFEDVCDQKNVRRIFKILLEAPFQTFMEAHLILLYEPFKKEKQENEHYAMQSLP
jgi:hypothetical protein